MDKGQGDEWSYGTALYFTFITLSTIGFGDITPPKGCPPVSGWAGLRDREGG